MLVLHGSFSPDRGFSLWAEDSEPAVTSRSQAMRSARPHPFAAPADVLAEICSGKPDDLVLQLPSLTKSPLDSPELIRLTPRPAANTEPLLLAWRIPVVVLEDAAALAWLESVSSGREIDVRYGASIGFFAELAAFARELTERGRVLPTVWQDEIGPLACWRPVLQGPDVIALGALATAMPPVNPAGKTPTTSSPTRCGRLSTPLCATGWKLTSASCRGGAGAVRNSYPPPRRGLRH